MLSLPLRTAEACDITSGLSKLIEHTYGEPTAKICQEDVSSLQALRAQSLTVDKAGWTTETEAAAAQQTLLSYYAMLTALQPHIGAEVREQQALSFSWKSAFDTDKAKVPDLKWELCGVQYNVAAALSARATLPALSGGDEIKKAARHLLLAAGVLQATLELRPSAALGTSTADMAESSLNALRQLMVAQAQACYCEKAALDKMRSTTQSQLCMGARQAFEQAAEVRRPGCDACGSLQGSGGRGSWLLTGSGAGRAPAGDTSPLVTCAGCRVIGADPQRTHISLSDSICVRVRCWVEVSCPSADGCPARGRVA